MKLSIKTEKEYQEKLAHLNEKIQDLSYQEALAIKKE